jgi:hypothetical protein
MTKLLDKAISKLRALPARTQDELAGYLIELVERPAKYRLTKAQMAEVELAIKEVGEGKVASQTEMDALWRRAGLSS